MVRQYRMPGVWLLLLLGLLGLQRLLDGRVHQRRHDLVTRGVGMETVVSELRTQQALIVLQRRMVVEVEKAFFLGVFLHPLVQLQDLVRRPRRYLRWGTNRKYAGQDDANTS